MKIHPIKILLITIMLQLACLSGILAQENSAQEALPQKTPLEIVELWNTCYGTADMDQCANLTTAAMRKEKPKSVWVYDTWKFLNAVEYRKEESEVLQEKIDGDAAVIVLQTRIYADGYVDQKELFKLIQVDGEWLIDDLIVGDEVLEEEKKQQL